MSHHISYSSFSTWCQCPYHWKLRYVDKLYTSEANIFLIFGKAMHSVMQTYLSTMYSSTISNADQLDLAKLLQQKLIEEFKNAKKEDEKNPCTQEELEEFFEDGIFILEWFRKHRSMYFSKRDWELIGCELPLDINLQKNLNFIGFIDVVLRHKPTQQIKIIDIKTSTMGWNKYVKKNKIKTSQLLLYKKFYAQQYDCPVEQITIEYFILKRKLYENLPYPQRRIQTFAPAHGSRSMNVLNSKLDNFIESCFDSNGKYKTNEQKNPNKQSCKWCEFYHTIHCDGEYK